MESSLHEIYKKKKINGEWFEFTGDDINKIVESIPEEARVYLDKSDKFSNIEEDTKGEKKIIGVRVQKLRGTFTNEERELLKAESMEKRRKNKEAGLSNSGQLLKDK
jgi:hypothetical protein